MLISSIGAIVFTLVHLVRSRTDKDIAFYTRDNAATF